MNLTLTDPALMKLSEIPCDHMVQLALDRGSCDIVNNVYEMKVIPPRELQNHERSIDYKGVTFIVDDDFEDAYDQELTIDFQKNAFVFKNKYQTFNNRVGLRFL
ncbi:iron-sulfur cluster biosynthesis family protein [Rossellomorea marisflavi]|uniref:iron-sulfur cluster biosynthesis family protein n=1 Tax=Rossellomorea marisflavi TaxID=189381 RepID=UPI00064F8639|nr:iron-sulfur cluster biosynthesis family protein [Rossellomorea marisflavi]KML27705.1 hypothetical protein VL12_20835 [Rossellomorea marisflavi]